MLFTEILRLLLKKKENKCIQLQKEVYCHDRYTIGNQARN